eukprot:GILJ01004605.1.p1 GENE.GILJ01004605.1~~GILJ01004605.1.p1  ORF type:complete len:445 (-),score=40.76 GILJ01004605.1:122-1408(-)
MPSVSVGTQTSIPLRDVVPTSVQKELPQEESEYPSFLFKAHSLALIAWLLGTIMAINWAVKEGHLITSTVDNVELGLWCALIAFLIFCCLHARDGLLYRPHPAFWRVVLGVAIAYFALLIFIICQDASDVRRWLRYIDPELGVPLPEKSYAADCRLYTPEDPVSSFRNLRDTIADEFVLAHLFGWALKMLIIRDVKMCLFLSVLFEFLEVSLRHALPNFWECWWDHVILDILICNGLGIYIGYLMVKYFEMKEYHFLVEPAPLTIKSKLNRIAKQFTPVHWSRYQWQYFSNSRRFFSVVFFSAFVSCVDLSAFFLKYVLYIPAPHYLNLVRLFIWVPFAVAGTREYYVYMSDPTCKRIGQMLWLDLAILLTEGCISYKFGKGLFNEPMPYWLKISWAVIATVVCGTFTVLFIRDYRKTHRKAAELKSE